MGVKVSGPIEAAAYCGYQCELTEDGLVSTNNLEEAIASIENIPGSSAADELRRLSALNGVHIADAITKIASMKKAHEAAIFGAFLSGLLSKTKEETEPKGSPKSFMVPWAGDSYTIH